MNWIKIFGEVNSIKVKSITDPLFRFSLFFAVIGGAVACLPAPEIAWMLLFGGSGICLLLGIVFYIYFAIKCPDYLRSESFQISKQSLEMLGDEKNKFNPNMERIIPIANPQVQDSGKTRLGGNTEQES